MRFCFTPCIPYLGMPLLRIQFLGILFLGMLWPVFENSACASSDLQSFIYGEHPLTDGMEPLIDEAVVYSLTFDSSLKLIFLTGYFQIGIVEALERSLVEHPQTSGLVLDSEGGNIYQARGIAIIIQERAFDTYVQHKCFSACVIPFIAGVDRYLIENSQIGFHSYRIETSPSGPLIDIEAEQEKDQAFFAKQIPDREFVGKIFQHKPAAFWKPTTEELLKAGVVHRVLSGRWQGDQ